MENTKSKEKATKDKNDMTITKPLDEDMLCGAGICYPTCLQKCGNITCYAVCYGLTVLVTNALNVYISSQITTIEKQFNLSSSQSGLILGCNDIGFILTVLFVSHFGIRYRIPRVLSLFTIIYGLSGIATSLIQLASGYKMPSNSDRFDNVRNNTDYTLCIPDREPFFACDNKGLDKRSTESSSSQTVFVLLCIFMGIQGVGKTPRSSLGTFYIDNNVQDKTSTGFYLGISTTLGLFGPFLAIILGGLFGKIPVDLKEVAIDPKDKRWVGAWWIGFLMFGILAVITAIPLAFFPRRLVSVSNDKIKDKSEVNELKTCLSIMKDIPKALFRVIRRPVYVMVVFTLGIYLFGVLGSVSFGPKYIENQFNIPTWKANLILGAEKLVPVTFGTFLGGYLTSRLKLSRQGCIKMIIIVMLITTALNSLNFIFGCENHKIQKNESFPNLCGCGGTNFLPVCDSKGKTFYSPCHAGCTNATNQMYSGCSAVDDGSVITGICDTGCSFLIPYISVQVLNTFFGTLSILPVYLVILRSLGDNDRSIALGMQSFMYALVVFLPAPIVFGHLFDSFCLEWNSSCGSKGSCALYDIEQMRYTLTSVEVGTRFIVFVIYLIIFHVAKHEDNKNDNSNKNDVEITVTAM